MYINHLSFVLSKGDKTMNSHVSLQPDPKGQPPMKLNHTLLLIKARIAWQNKSQQQRTFSSLFQSARGNRSTMSTPFSLSPQTSSGRNLHVKYVDLNSTPQSDSRSQRTTQGGVSTLLPPTIRSLQSMHEGFSTTFPPTKTLKSMHKEFSTTFPPTKTLKSIHEAFSTTFPPTTKGLRATYGRFSTPGTSVNRRYVGFSHINPGRYTSISSPIAGLGSDSSPPEALIAA
jgi:hypothetical protein